MGNKTCFLCVCVGVPGPVSAPVSLCCHGCAPKAAVTELSQPAERERFDTEEGIPEERTLMNGAARLGTN